MRGYSDFDIHNESTGETYGQYRRRETLKEFKPLIEWGAVIAIIIAVITISFTIF